MLVGDCWSLMFWVKRVAVVRCWSGFWRWTTPLLPVWFSLVVTGIGLAPETFVVMAAKSLGWRLICCCPFFPCCTWMWTVVGWRFRFPSFLCFWFWIPPWWRCWVCAITPVFCGRVVANLTILQNFQYIHSTISKTLFQ